jgi:hypothetical protein
MPPSDEIVATGKMLRTWTLNATELFTETNGLSATIIWGKAVRRVIYMPIGGYVAAIALLIVTGMCFWVRSAYLEANKIKVQSRPHDNYSDDLSTSYR